MLRRNVVPAPDLDEPVKAVHRPRLPARLSEYRGHEELMSEPTRRVLELARGGLDPSEIRAATGYTQSQVASALGRLRAAGHLPPGRSAAPPGANAAAVLSALASGARTTSEVEEATGLGRVSAAHALTHLVQSGQAVRISRGVYGLPG